MIADGTSNTQGQAVGYGGLAAIAPLYGQGLCPQDVNTARPE